MRYSFLLAVLVLVVFSVVGLQIRGAEKDGAPSMATIVVEGAVGRDGVGEMRAIRIVDPQKLSMLESFFPGYRSRPTNKTAAGWMASHRVYFDFAGGETIRVTVSQNENARFWSVGRGDFRTKGDFVAFVRTLVEEE